MYKKRLVLLLLLGCFLFSSGCSTPETAENVDYEKTKKMIVDILKTDEGKKALKEILSDEEFKADLVLENTVVTESIEKTLVSDKGKEFWKKAFEDPEFAKAFATSMKDESESLMKNLMNDPEYRAKMVELLHDPELEKELADLLKSTEYREHLQKVITETMENPLFQTKIQEILLKAAEEQGKKASE